VQLAAEQRKLRRTVQIASGGGGEISPFLKGIARGKELVRQIYWSPRLGPFARILNAGEKGGHVTFAWASVLVYETG